MATNRLEKIGETMQIIRMVYCWDEGSISIAIVKKNAYKRMLRIVKENM